MIKNYCDEKVFINCCDGIDRIFSGVFVNIMLISQDIVSILVYNRYFWRRNEISLSIEMIK